MIRGTLTDIAQTGETLQQTRQVLLEQRALCGYIIRRGKYEHGRVLIQLIELMPCIINIGGGQIAGSNNNLTVIDTVSDGTGMGEHNRSDRLNGNISFWRVE